jgi:hypothetical protein
MNLVRMLAGGLAAGVFNNVSGMTGATLFFARPTLAALEAHQLRVFGPQDALPHVLMRLGFGVAAVWLYAALGAQFGRGPGTAVIAGVVVWLLSYLYSFWFLTHIGLVTRGLAAGALGWGFAEMLLTALLGAWIYTGLGFWSGA